MQEEIKGPARYKRGGLEVWDIEKAFFGQQSFEDHLAMAAVEYVLRHSMKNGMADIRKAEFVLHRLGDELEAHENDVARVWCKHDSTKKCVCCEGCADEGEAKHD